MKLTGLLCTALFCATTVTVAAQPVSFGVKAGVPVTDALETFQGNQSAYVTNTHRYLFGPTVQLNFPFRFSVEVDALYKRLGFEYNQFGGPGSPTTTRTVANSWEFPVLGKYALFGGPIRPFLDAGANFRHISGVDQIRSTLTAVDVNVNPVVEFNKDNDIGFAFGGGIELKVGVVRVTPEFRYTRWGSENFRDPVSALLRTNKNQGDFILGLTF
jgi:opacity protein-like surface antigen